MTDTTTPKDGGPAFPYAFQHEDAAHFTSAGFAPGMTLRAWFAGKAMAGLLADADTMHAIGDVARTKRVGVHTAAAQMSVIYADALIVELNKA